MFKLSCIVPEENIERLIDFLTAKDFDYVYEEENKCTLYKTKLSFFRVYTHEGGLVPEKHVCGYFSQRNLTISFVVILTFNFKARAIKTENVDVVSSNPRFYMDYELDSLLNTPMAVNETRSLLNTPMAVNETKKEEKLKGASVKSVTVDERCKNSTNKKKSKKDKKIIFLKRQLEARRMRIEKLVEELADAYFELNDLRSENDLLKKKLEQAENNLSRSDEVSIRANRAGVALAARNKMLVQERDELSETLEKMRASKEQNTELIASLTSENEAKQQELEKMNNELTLYKISCAINLVTVKALSARLTELTEQTRLYSEILKTLGVTVK